MSKNYPDLNDLNFNEKFLNKYEFKDKEQSPVYQHSRQLFLRNVMNPNTIYDSILLYWNVGTGKCHGKDTKIMMYDGSIKMVQDIKKGELLMGDDSTPREILSIARGIDKLYDISNKKDESYVVNEEHILCLKAYKYPLIINNITNNNYKIKYIKNNKFMSKIYKYNSNTKLKQNLKIKKHSAMINDEQIIEISVKNYIKLSESKKSMLKGYKVEIDFSYKKVKLDAYTVGFLIGSEYESKKIINIKNEVILKKIKKNIKLKCKFKNNYKILDKKINLLEEKGILNIYKYNSKENRLALLAGLLDSNGNLTNNYSEYEFSKSLKNEKIVDDIIYICRSLGLSCNKYRNNKYYRVNISGENIKKIPSIYKEKIIKVKNVLMRKIYVKYINEDNYYGFTLNKNNRYVLGNFSVTHNTCAAISIAEGFKEYMNNMNRKILVIVKNNSIIKNFKQQLETDCGSNEYKTYNDYDELEQGNIDIERKKVINNKIRKRINNTYYFTTYGKFTSDVLGKTINNTSSILKIRNKSPDSLTNLNNTIIIIDEAHHVTNTDTYKALKLILENSYNYRLILLTATPILDNPQQIIELCNLLNISDKTQSLLPIRDNAFKNNNKGAILKKTYVKNSLIKEGIIKLTDLGEKELLKRMKGKVSYYETTVENYPTKINIGVGLTDLAGSLIVKNCIMSDYQYKIYKKSFLLDISSEGRGKEKENENEKENEDFVEGSGSSLYKNSSDASTFVYPNGLVGKLGFKKCFNKVGIEYELKKEYINIMTNDLEKYSTKLFNILNNIKNSDGKIFIFSKRVNYGGTSLIKQLLLANGYSQYGKGKSTKGVFIIFDGNTLQETRESQLKTFNSKGNVRGEIIKIIIGSEIIAEGLTLKNIRQIHILDPDWNMGIINQIIGRGVRLNSHKELNENERDVKIYKYNAIGNLSNELDSNINFIDKEKYFLAERKDRANKKAERILKIAAIDCSINKKMQIKDSKIKGEPECDYTTCEYKCLIDTNLKDTSDKFTYKYYIDFFDKYDIEFITGMIRELFEKYFIWSLDDIIDIIKRQYSEISNESIYTSIITIVNNRTNLYDKYNREGFIIQRKNYFIFNPINVDINSSIYSKMLNFKTHVNEYLSINDYITKTQNITLKKKEKKQKANMLLIANDSDNLSKEDTEFNINIRDTSDLYGSYRYKKDKKDNKMFGIIDNKFRIIDNRLKNIGQLDNRKQNTGMVSSSLDKSKLLEIVNYFKISDIKAKRYLETTSDILISKLSKIQLIKIIEKYLNENDLVFK